MATVTLNPDASPGTTSISGFIEYNTSGITWSTAVSASAGTSQDTVTSPTNIGHVEFFNGTQAIIHRSIFIFDTSSIPSGAVINSATFSVFGTTKNNAGSAGSAAWNIYQTSATAANTTLATSDYNKVTTTAICNTSISQASWNTTGYNDFVLNATGLSLISGGAGAIMRIGFREVTYDVGNSSPGNSGDNYAHVEGNTGDSGSNKPKITITYTVSGVASRIVIVAQSINRAATY